MRYTLAATAVMLVAAQFASARGEPPSATSPEPPAKFNADRPGAKNGDRLAAKNAEELKKKVEEVGFKDVEIVPQMFVVLAKKPDGKGVSMIVDAETLQALQLGGDDPDQGGDEPDQSPQATCPGSSGQPL